MANHLGFLHASGAETATGTGTAISGLGNAKVLQFELDVTAAATAAGDTIDVYVQTMIDGTNWVDIVHFTQVLGNGGAKRFYAKISSNLAESLFNNATALAAGSVRNIFGDQYRAAWTVASATAPSFTFSLQMSGDER